MRLAAWSARNRCWLSCACSFCARWRWAAASLPPRLAAARRVSTCCGVGWGGAGVRGGDVTVGGWQEGLAAARKDSTNLG